MFRPTFFVLYFFRYVKEPKILTHQYYKLCCSGCAALSSPDFPLTQHFVPFKESIADPHTIHAAIDRYRSALKVGEHQGGSNSR